MPLITKKPNLFAALIAGLLLITAFAFEAAGYPPCDLCWKQRYPYMVIVILGLFAAAAGKEKNHTILLLIMLLFALDAAIAGYHVGVEQQWWQGPTSCTGGGSLLGSASDALETIMNRPLVLCDEVAWSLFGISMAGYNFIAATVMTAFTARILKK